MSYGNWPIGRKLAAVLGSILLLFVSSSGLAIYQSLQQDRMLSHMMDEVLVTERALKNWSMNVTAGVQRAAAIAKSDDASLVQYFDKATKEATADTWRSARKSPRSRPPAMPRGRTASSPSSSSPP